MKLLKKETFWHKIGCALSLILILLGVVFATNPPDSFITRWVSSYTFGGDFYTYEYEATQAAVKNTAATADNLEKMGTAQARYVGAAFGMAGLFGLVHFGQKLAMALPAEPEAAASAEAVCDVTPPAEPGASAEGSEAEPAPPEAAEETTEE